MDLSKKILVVDDFPSVRRLLLTALKKIGFSDIHLSEDGATALDALNRKKFDLILADWNMPGIDGMALLKTIRSKDKFKDIPFMMVTAETTKENVIQAIEAGANSYIVKPFTFEALEAKISRIFDK